MMDGHAKVTIGHHNSGRCGQNGHFIHLGNGPIHHQQGHKGYRTFFSDFISIF